MPAMHEEPHEAEEDQPGQERQEDLIGSASGFGAGGRLEGDATGRSRCSAWCAA
jgi:hypothetical protein